MEHMKAFENFHFAKHNENGHKMASSKQPSGIFGVFSIFQLSAYYL